MSLDTQRIAFILGLSLAVAAPSAAQSSTYAVVQVPGFGQSPTTIVSINDDGAVVGTSRDTTGKFRGFIYLSRSQELVQIPTLGGDLVWPNDINNTGKVVGRALLVTGNVHAFIFDSVTHSMQDLGTLGGQNSSALAISDDDVVVGWSEINSGERRAFRLDLSTMTWTQLDTLGGPESEARDIDSFGRIVGIADVDSQTSSAAAWICTATCEVQLILTPATGSSAAWVAAGDGQVAGAAETAAGISGFITTLGDLFSIDVGTLGGSYSAAFGRNAGETVVGEAEAAGGGFLAFVIKDGIMLDLNGLATVPDGWLLHSAQAANSKGQIAANGWRDLSSGQSPQELGAFILTPPSGSDLIETAATPGSHSARRQVHGDRHETIGALFSEHPLCDGPAPAPGTTIS